MIINGFVLEPDKELLPDYKISPFYTGDLVKNKNLPESDICDLFFKERFKDRDYIYTQSGREAINKALLYFDLNKNDCVTILTTTGNFYISSCVTKEIEKFCTWSRIIEENTKIILVNHEFGYPYKELLKLREYSLPIIEDCAHSFFTKDNEGAIGTVGDFVIYSFPKMFPLQIGGLLVSNLLNGIEKSNRIDEVKLKYIKKVLTHHLKSDEKIINKRIFNYNYLKDKFMSLDLTERFQLNHGIVPGVFMFQTNGQNIDLPELKKYYYAHGVQCSVFFGEESFFIPVHQSLDEQDLDYFYEVIKSFIQKPL
jgi:hypothetical protein